ncbi:MAG: hypothetical protein QF701_05330 [Nitrospinota bacterium]|jgi:hypothetical protein|nr:hypothetical protein [Nitrospinota bacterium]MDP7167164.1 hypothetical protein [Nitrospinota bacterium]MDP7370859.1 hypothetical protein [Nitrospinota bacterium]MDP7503214.1 hypothetical protein [Nitrospinota bacterium]MDP7662075.1 hypothetical protein [Nitrospinota bacterium]
MGAGLMGGDEDGREAARLGVSGDAGEGLMAGRIVGGLLPEAGGVAVAGQVPGKLDGNRSALLE